MSDIETKNGIAEHTAEMALAERIDILQKDNTDKEIRLMEALTLLDSKDKELDKLQSDYDLKCEELHELKAIEIKRTQQQDFVPASKVQSPPKVWVAAVNAINLFKGLNDASKYAIENNDPWKKVVFDVSAEGQLKNARLEE
jgi:hypothetical protein